MANEFEAADRRDDFVVWAGARLGRSCGSGVARARRADGGDKPMTGAAPILAGDSAVRSALAIPRLAI